MFLDFYRLREQPFGVTPDPRFLYLTDSHREALASLFYGIQEDRGFVSLIAPPGMGKTTLLFQLMERLQGSAYTAFVFQTQCDSRELLRYILADLELDAHDNDMVTMNDKLNKELIRIRQSGKRFVLILDEAQNFDESVLETIRLLSDFETPRSKLMQIVLSGQPGLAKRLVGPRLTQLRQRISIYARLQPLSAAELRRYIEHRLTVAGHGKGGLFTPEAYALIASHSGGVPRNINALCFSALSLGYAMGRTMIDGKIVKEAIADLDLDGQTRNLQMPASVSKQDRQEVPARIGTPEGTRSRSQRTLQLVALALWSLLAALLAQTVLGHRPGQVAVGQNTRFASSVGSTAVTQATQKSLKSTREPDRTSKTHHKRLPSSKKSERVKRVARRLHQPISEARTSRKTSVYHSSSVTPTRPSGQSALVVDSSSVPPGLEVFIERKFSDGRSGGSVSSTRSSWSWSVAPAGNRKANGPLELPPLSNPSRSQMTTGGETPRAASPPGSEISQSPAKQSSLLQGASSR